MSSKSSSGNESKKGGVKTKTITSSKKSTSGNESKKGGVKAKKPKSSKKSGLKSKKPAKKSSSKSKKPKSPKKKSSKRGGSHGYAQMFKSSLSPCYEGVEKKSWHGGMEKVVGPLGNDMMNRELLARQVSPTFTMDDVQQLGPAEWAATRNESPLQDARGEVSGWSSTDSGPAPVSQDGSGKGKKKKSSSKKKSILGKTKNFLSLLLSKTKSVVKKSANFVKSKVSGDKKKKSTKKSTKKSVKKSTKTDKKKKAKKSVKKDK